MTNIELIKNRGSEYSKWYQFTNNKNERVVVEISRTECDPKDKSCLPNLWVKHGFMKTPIYNYLSAQTYVYTENGCYGKYNPTIKLSENGHRHVIDFDWMLEATGENEEKILNEIYRLANL